MLRSRRSRRRAEASFPLRVFPSLRPSVAACVTGATGIESSSAERGQRAAVRSVIANDAAVSGVFVTSRAVDRVWV